MKGKQIREFRSMIDLPAPVRYLRYFTTKALKNINSVGVVRVGNKGM